MRKSELPGTEGIQVESGRPLRPYRGLDEVIQKGLLVFKCHDSETLDSRVMTPPNVRAMHSQVWWVGGRVCA